MWEVNLHTRRFVNNQNPVPSGLSHTGSHIGFCSPTVLSQENIASSQPVESLPEPPCSLILLTNSQPLSVLVADIIDLRKQTGTWETRPFNHFLCLSMGSMPSFSELHFHCHHESRCSGPFYCMLRTVLLKEFQSGKPNPKQNRKLDTIGTQIQNIIVLCSPCLLLSYHLATLVRNQD